MSTEPYCIVAGSINIDEFFRLPHIVLPGETISSASFTKRAGGKGANQALALARAGANVQMVGAVGNDGEWILENLAKDGVDTNGVAIREKDVTGRAVIQVGEDGENSIILLKAANYLPPTPPSTFSTPAPQYLCIQNEIPLPTTLQWLSLCASAQTRVVYNPSPMLSQAEISSFPWKDVSVLFINEGEALTLLAALPTATVSAPSRFSTPPPPPLPPQMEKPYSILKSLFFHPSLNSSVTIIMTLGSKGSLALSVESPQSPIFTPSVKVDKVKDTTGAGDTFTGFVVASLLSGKPLANALKVGTMASALCVQKDGAQESIPLAKDVAQALSHS